MNRRVSGDRRRPGASGVAADNAGGWRWVAIGGGIVVLIAAAVWYWLQPSRAARIASETIRLQEEALAGVTDAASSGARIGEIMRNVDRLPPDGIRRVRESLFRRLKEMRDESLAKFHDALPAERSALLDRDLERIQTAQAILDATDQGGMRPFTEAELVEREQRRRDNAPAKPAAPERPRPAAAEPSRTDEQKLAADYFEALTKRAKEKKVELGRMFGRPPGRG